VHRKIAVSLRSTESWQSPIQSTWQRSQYPPAFKIGFRPYLTCIALTNKNFFSKFFEKVVGRRLMCGGNDGGYHCKYDYHALKRVRALLDYVGVTEFHRLLDET